MIPRSRVLARCAAALLLDVLLFALPSPRAALAHAFLLASSPAPSSLIEHSPPVLYLQFSEAVNASASRVIVWDRQRHDRVAGAVRVYLDAPDQLAVPLRRLASGAYRVLWISVSADDGHLVKGTYVFYVRRRAAPASTAGTTFGAASTAFPDAAALAAVLARWLELLAITAWTGASFISLLAFTPVTGRLPFALGEWEYARYRRLVWIAVPLSVVSGTVSLLLSARALAGGSWSGAFSGVTLRELLASQFGEVWVARQVLALLALLVGIAVVRGWTETPSRREFTAGQTVIGAVYLFALAAGGHAAGVNVGTIGGSHGNLFSLAIGIDLAHLLGDALWLGGQFYLAVVALPVLRGLPDARTRLLQHFRPAALTAVASFAVTGPFNAAVHLPTPLSLLTSLYGQVLLAKIALIAVMVLSSRRIALARAAPERLTAGPLLGAGVLLASAVMFLYPAPGSGAAGTQLAALHRPVGPRQTSNYGENFHISIRLRADGMKIATGGVPHPAGRN